MSAVAKLRILFEEAAANAGKEPEVDKTRLALTKRLYGPAAHRGSRRRATAALSWGNSAGEFAQRIGSAHGACQQHLSGLLV
jgi:hypothetical protein